MTELSLYKAKPLHLMLASIAEPRKRGLLVCCFKAYSRGQKRWSSLTAPEEEEGEVAWGLSSREEEAQVRQLACEGLGMTDAEVGRFVKVSHTR